MASPLGFSQAGRHFYDGVLVPRVRDLGYDVLDPWTLTDPGKLAAVQALPYGPARREAWRILNREIGANNRNAIRPESRSEQARALGAKSYGGATVSRANERPAGVSGESFGRVSPTSARRSDTTKSRQRET